MIARALLTLFAVLLLLGAVSSLFAPRELRAGNGAAALGAAAANSAEPTAGQVTQRVAGHVPDAEPIRARLGDVVRIEAKVEADDVVVVDDLGITTPVTAGIPALIELVATQAGSFPITLRYSGKEIGTLVVAGEQPRPGAQPAG